MACALDSTSEENGGRAGIISHLSFDMSHLAISEYFEVVRVCLDRSRVLAVGL